MVTDSMGCGRTFSSAKLNNTYKPSLEVPFGRANASAVSIEPDAVDINGYESGVGYDMLENVMENFRELFIARVGHADIPLELLKQEMGTDSEP